MLQLRALVDQGAMSTKGYFTFPSALGQKPHHQIQLRVISRDAVGVFYCPSQLGKRERERERKREGGREGEICGSK